MLMFPPEYSPRNLPAGYLWNTQKHALYSFKGGTLKMMTHTRGGWCSWLKCHIPEPFYTISVNGKKVRLPVSVLRRVEVDHDIHVMIETGVATVR